MPTIDLPQLVQDTLIETYVKVRGEKPEGGFYPNEVTMDTIRQQWGREPKEKLINFLQEAMFAHIARTEITKTPFFVNAHLFAASSLDFMEKHRKYLKSFYGSGYEPKRFEQSVFGAVLASEVDYLDTFGNSFVRTGVLPSFEFIMPSVWWMIWADTFWRLRQTDFPASWLAQRLLHEGVRQTAEQMISRERSKIKDRFRYEVAEKAAKMAIQEAAMGWAGRHRAVQVLYEDGRGYVAPDSAIPAQILEAAKPLDVRDLTLFEAVRTHGRMRVAHPEHGNREVSEAEQGRWRRNYTNPEKLDRQMVELGKTDDA